MADKNIIPIFPLNILPIKEELIPLHIFEPRYRQLLKDAEDNDILFGILYAVSSNEDRVGALVKLESILKRYDTGESDIVVKCVGSFLLERYFKHFKDRMYAGGEIILLPEEKSGRVSEELRNEYLNYQELIKANQIKNITAHDIANALDLDNSDRLKYVRLLSLEKRERFLLERLKYKSFIIEQEKHQSKFSLN